MSAIQRSILFTAVGTVLALFALGCGDQADTPAPPESAAPAPAAPAGDPTPPVPPAPDESPDTAPAKSAAVKADVKAGADDYQIYCASCHGATGEGDGPVAQALNPKPARHSDGAYMNSLTDEYLFKVIKFGGASVGKSPMMAPLGGSLSDQQIHNVIAFVRSLADPPYQP